MREIEKTVEWKLEMVELQFIWEILSSYEDDDDNLTNELVEIYDGETIEEACDNAAACWDWNDEDVYNFDAKSELIETSRDLKNISVNVEDKWKEVNLDVYEIYEKAEAKAMGLE